MSKVKDVIEADQPIPADVTEFTDCDGRPWSLSEVGHWHTSEDAVEACAAGECYEDAAWKMLTRYMPLTVTAVREPEPAAVHYRELNEGAALCGVRWSAEDSSTVWREVTCEECRATRNSLAEAEQPTAAPSVLLDLVRQYGGETQRLGSAHHGGSAQVVEEYTSRAKATFDRIAALVPQQPDPSVLSLPQVPPGTVALIGGTTGRRYPRQTAAPDDEVLWADPSRGMLLITFSGVLVHEGSVTVVMREPRTWPMLAVNTPLAPAAMPDYVTVQGWGTYGRREDGLYAATEGYPDDVAREHCLTFDALRALGDVTEVFEDEPGGEPR